MKVLSLFDGISCGMVALERADIKVDRYIAYEIDKYAIQVSEKNYPQIEHKGDVFDANFKEYKGFDLLIGGSPCTYWSIAQNPKNRETISSGLGWELFSQYVRALKECKPKYFLYENNYSMSQEIKNAITKELEVEPIYINSALVSAQNRKRYYWTNIPNVSQPDDLGIMLTDVIDFNIETFRPLGNWVYKKWGDKRKIDMLRDVNSKKSHTLTTNGTHSNAYYLNKAHTQYCNLTVRDWEKLQTLPVNYTAGISNTQRYKCIGNGWTVDVIVHIFKHLKDEERN